MLYNRENLCYNKEKFFRMVTIMPRILAIGNSFSEDATRYLYKISAADNKPMRLYNLYIGGCPLSRHFRLMKTGESAYDFQFNGMKTGMSISIPKAVLVDEWDYITLQQVSHQSPRYETYQPYLNALAAYIRENNPKAKLMIHQTWAYEQGSRRLCEELGYADQADMFRDVKASYDKAAAEIKADGIIPSGELFQRMLKNGFDTVHRDTFHAHLGYGRYALAALWYDLLTGNDVRGNTFRDLDVPSDGVDFELIQKLAHELADEYRIRK